MSQMMLNLSAGPQTRDKWTTQFIMIMVVVALLPATIVGIAVNGVYAGLIVLSSVLTAFLTEFLYDKITGRPDTWKDGSAVVTGLLLALSLSPSTPLYAPILGSIFAILVVKCAFGGLGKNFINPALAARCFLLLSFGSSMTIFKVDGVAMATPLAELSAGRAVNVTDMFLGTGGGVIGASILALLVGGLVLWVMDIIHGQIWISIIVAFTLFMGLFGGQGFDPAYLAAQLCGGGVIMGAFFMATDYTTSPVSRLGQTVYGVMIGVLGALFRVFGNAADSFSYSIIIANLFTPLIETYIIPKPYAYRKSALDKMAGKEKVPFTKKIPKPVFVLAAITLLAGLALSGVFSMTEDTIAEQKRAENAASYQAVLPEAANFKFSSDIDKMIEQMAADVYGGGSFGKAHINAAAMGVDASGNPVGYVVSATSGDGMEGNVTLTVGLDMDGKILGIAFTELNETPGLGMKADEPAFKDQFTGKAEQQLKVVKGGASASNEIDSISGATITSRAVVNAVNAGLDFFHNVLKGGTWFE
ncbi:MAG: RnfABCDGE type electron transport complex subunit D [Firmicutes bacterium]|nr:RnfABCDGE type electron transport complex subunit D [Bacillota bacterium]